MAQQPDPDGGTGPEPARGGGRPGSHGAAGEPTRDPRLAGFARGGAWDTCPPSAALATALEQLSGPDWRGPGATDDEIAGLVRQWSALESWAAAGKLGVIREMMRRDQDVPWPVPRHGDLPDSCSESVHHELAAALAMPPQSAEKLAWVAWEVQARLPGIGALLSGGVLTQSKARAIAEEFKYLSDEHAAQAETLIRDQLPGKTHGQVMRLAAQAACAVDPAGVAERRRQAEQDHARVRLWREQTGAAALAGYGLPTDEALAAHANVTARAAEYKASKAFPDARMDEIRVLAYLDLLNEVPAADRVARARASAGAEAAAAEAGAEAGTRDGGPGEGSPDDGESEDGNPGGGHPGGGSGPDGTQPGGGGAERRKPPVPQDLVVPLVTLLGLGERPGEGHGLGPLDPALARDLAAAAAASPGSRLCVTVTSPDGYAIGHGCARPEWQDRTGRTDRTGQAGAAPARQRAGTATGGPLAGFPARVNLTIPLDVLGAARALGPPEAGGWSFARRDGPGPPGGFGTWALTLPGGRKLIVRLEPVPTFGCDHHHESHAYQPTDMLRHLVQVRDGTCTFPTCSRHARESDFEHAIPYHRGGRTCACNAGARSRKCHRVKQSPGWNVSQPAPGLHRWTTPAGRVYTQEPKRYPALSLPRFRVFAVSGAKAGRLVLSRVGRAGSQGAGSQGEGITDDGNREF